MKKYENHIGEVTELKFPNKGIVKTMEKDVVMVKNTLPGQQVEFSLTKNRQGKKEGRLIRVVKQSEKETEQSPCPHFEHCGGCSYQTLSYQSQKELKLNQVKALLGQLSQEVKIEKCLESPKQWEYRNKMEFSFGDETKGGPLTLGLHKKGGFYDIVSVEYCHIVPMDFRTVLQTTQKYFKELGVSFYHKMTHKGYLRHLMIRRGEKSGELLICLITSSERHDVLDTYVEALLEKQYEGKIVGVLHIMNDSLSDVVQSDKTKILYGQDYFYEKILDLKFKISPFSFFQTNSLGAEVLYKIVRDYIGDIGGKVIFDLYSGTGTIAQVLAPIAKRIVGIEIVEEAVEAARENATLNQLDNCEFIVGDVGKVMKEITKKPDFIVLDPPREGVHPKTLRKIIEYGVERMVYISCKPTSLVRDLEILYEGGYEVVKAECVDMFPWTRGIETVVGLHRKDT